jgi:hypothetical protein
MNRLPHVRVSFSLPGLAYMRPDAGTSVTDPVTSSVRPRRRRRGCRIARSLCIGQNPRYPAGSDDFGVNADAESRRSSARAIGLVVVPVRVVAYGLVSLSDDAFLMLCDCR